MHSRKHDTDHASERGTCASSTHCAEPEYDRARNRPRPPKAPADAALCAGCGATYYRRRWSLSPPPPIEGARPDRPLGVRLCPACRRRETSVPKGFVHVDGDWVRGHRTEVESLLQGELSRAGTASPMAQLVYWGDDGAGGLLVTTTTEHLAVRLGRALEAAYDGELRYGFAHENTLAHVWWRRDD